MMGKKSVHYGNHMAVSKVLSLLKTLPCDSAEDISDIGCTRRMLIKLQLQEYDKDMAVFKKNMEGSQEKNSSEFENARLRANIIGQSFGGTGAI